MSGEKIIDNFIKQIDSMRVNIANGRPAFKKPLLLLLIISKIEHGILTSNIIRYQELEEELSELILNYGGRSYSGSTKPNQPFQYLNSSSFWHLSLANGEPVSSKIDISLKLLRDENTFATIQQEVFSVLISSANARARVAQFILQKWWTETIQQELIEVLKLPIYQVISLQKRRNKDFTDQVLANYRYSCAVCGFSASLNKSVFGIDGAHIKWFSMDGPDSVENGLALCKTHHWAFDKGAISVSAINHKILVTDKFIGRDKNSIEIIEGMKDKELMSYKDVEPAKQYLEWHNQHIFLG